MIHELRVAVVLIGRNEGARLVAALASIPSGVAPVVYVDSGSTDGSVAVAEAAGALVVRLDMESPFTAARARNAGFAALGADPPELVQFMDGDCTLDPAWIGTASTFLADNPQAAAVCGRRRERYPEASIYNWLCDQEWDTAVGRTKSCGGDVMMRHQAFTAVRGFDPNLIAGEEPELCVRLRVAGWEIWRLDAEMTLHDAAMTRFAQWWKRTRRSGHAFAEGAALHGRPPENHCVRETRSALAWGLGLPLVSALGALLISPWALLVLLAWPLQLLRLSLRLGPIRAAFLVMGKVPEALGIVEYWWGRLTGKRRGLIEYK